LVVLAAGRTVHQIILAVELELSVKGKTAVWVVRLLPEVVAVAVALALSEATAALAAQAVTGGLE
jgi:hypothetical protein